MVMFLIAWFKNKANKNIGHYKFLGKYGTNECRIELMVWKDLIKTSFTVTICSRMPSVPEFHTCCTNIIISSSFLSLSKVFPLL